MPYPFQPWRAAYQPASFGGAAFKVEVDSQAGGRRNAVHEFPHRDTPWAEDMGRKARRWAVTAYIIGPTYTSARDALIAACELEGPQTLVHPLLGRMQACCDDYTAVERRELGGYCVFELRFVEAGTQPATGVATDTQSAATAAANNLTSASTSGIDGINSNLQPTGDASESFNPAAPDVSVPFNGNGVEVNPTPGVSAPYAGQGAISGRV